MSQISKDSSIESLVTIIIPVYNAANFLKDCIESAISQTHQNLQIICIDDASGDKSNAILTAYEKKDNRIHLIQLDTNQGVSNARNIGLDNAKGEWIAWLDADDIYHPRFIEILLNTAIAYNADIVECEAEYFSCNNLPQFIIEDEVKPTFGDGYEFLRRFGLREIQTALWSKLIKKELFNDFRFPKGRIYEEPYFYFSSYQRFNNVVFLPLKLYAYRNTPKSIMKGFSASTIDSYLNLMQYMAICVQQLPVYREEIINRIAADLIRLWQQALYSDNQTEQLSTINRNIDNILIRTLDFKPCNLKARLILTFKDSPIFRTILKRYNHLKLNIKPNY